MYLLGQDIAIINRNWRIREMMFWKSAKIIIKIKVCWD